MIFKVIVRLVADDCCLFLLMFSLRFVATVKKTGFDVLESQEVTLLNGHKFAPPNSNFTYAVFQSRVFLITSKKFASNVFLFLGRPGMKSSSV